MLMQMDRFDGVVIFATNLQQNYDSAFVRRILAHLEFELPDEACRKQLWEQLLPIEVPREPGIDAQWLASVTKGLSGGDIRTVILTAAGRAVQRTADSQFVTRADFEEEAQEVRRAKDSIGTQARSPVRVVEEVPPVSELPSEVKGRYELATGGRDPSR
jgi:ATP-dependent 26S proteasome regulatory subunit